MRTSTQRPGKPFSGPRASVLMKDLVAEVLRIQSLKRGYPFVPSQEPEVAIDAGGRCGLKLWARFKPGQRQVMTRSVSGLAGCTQFRLCDYLKVFLSIIGEASRLRGGELLRCKRF